MARRRRPDGSATEGPDVEDLASVEARLGYAFVDRALLERALTHSSCKEELRPSNERLEFLGDAVLGLVVAEFLFSAFPDLEEGPLTRVRSAVVSTRSLEGVARRLGLARALRLGRGLSRAELPPSVLADVLEAIIGALFLDRGLAPARAFVLEHLAEALDDELEARLRSNWKSVLQERVQQGGGAAPTYVVLEETGPDHQKAFVVAVVVSGQERGRGAGPSKKAAEQEAARAALGPESTEQ